MGNGYLAPLNKYIPFSDQMVSELRVEHLFVQKVLKQCKRLTILFVANGCLNKKGFLFDIWLKLVI